jgi:hypothetical protein
MSLSGGRWSAAVQVALDIDRLRLLPLADGEIGALDVGALLHHVDGGKSWEMLVGAKVRKPAGRKTNQSILHRRILENLAPGRYRLVAFARNREQDLFGGAEAVIDLPSVRGGGLAGPIVLYADREFFPSALPLMDEEMPAEAPIQAISTGSVPVLEDAIETGDLLEVASWLCPASPAGGEAAGPATGPALVRYVARDGEPVFRLPEPVVEEAGSCLRVVDRLVTAFLPPGPYTYHLSWLDTESREPREVTAEFRILEPSRQPRHATAGP